MKLLNLTSERFGRLKVLRRAPNDRNRRVFWECECECGKFTIVQSGNLQSGHTQSCGCLREEAAKAIYFRHGLSSTRAYSSWLDAKHRCYKTANHAFPDYGGRGIKMCDKWKNDFAAFFADMGECPEGLTLDRYPDNDGDYEPSNCRWATRKQQALNRRLPKNSLVPLRGTVFGLLGEGIRQFQIAEILGISRSNVSKVRKHFSHDDKDR